MFLIRQPSLETVERFLAESRDLPLSYRHVGMALRGEPGYNLDEHAEPIGTGAAAFDRACEALKQWKHFDTGWTETYPLDAPTRTGTVVAVAIRHLGFWSINGARVVYQVGKRGGAPRFGFAYGTLTSHAETGEEVFEVEHDLETGEVLYRLRAVSRPRAALARG